MGVGRGWEGCTEPRTQLVEQGPAQAGQSCCGLGGGALLSIQSPETLAGLSHGDLSGRLRILLVSMVTADLHPACV